MTGQTFRTIDVLRLDVQQTPTGLTNYLRNSRGELGGWGWLTPIAGQTMDGFGTVSNGGDLSFFAGGPDTTATYFTSEPIPIVAGHLAAGRITVLDAAAPKAGTQRVRLEFSNDAGAVVASGVQSAAATGPGVRVAPTTAAPTGATRVALRVDVTLATAGQPSIEFTDAMLTHHATALAADFPYVPPIAWTNILGPSHELTITRADIQPGTLSAVVYDATLDPATNGALAPGKAVQVWCTTAGEPLFSGTITNALVEYDLAQKKANRRAKISITATDNVAKTSNVVRPKGVANIDDLKAVFEGGGIPWSIHGSTQQASYDPTYVSEVKDASLLDQIVLTRDTVLGYAWCNRWGQMAINEAGGDIPLTGGPVHATLTTAAYSGLDVNYNTDDCVNTVTVKLLRANLATGETVTITHGPYKNQASIDQWGAFSAEYTVHGLTDDEATMKAYADQILAANASPKVRVNGMQIPIMTTADLSAAVGARRALLDLYMAARVVNQTGGIDEVSLVSGITHSITPSKWLMNLTFVTPTSTARSQTTAKP